MHLIHGVYWHTVQFSARCRRYMRDTSSKEGRLRYAASSKSETKGKLCWEGCVPIIYLGNGAQDSGSPTCAPVPVTCKCDYGRRTASAKTSLAMSPMNVAYSLYQVIIDRPLFSPIHTFIMLFVRSSEMRSEARKENAMIKCRKSVNGRWRR